MKRIVAFLLIWVALIAGAETYKPVQKGEKWGIQNSAGKWSAKPRYFEIRPFGDNFFVRITARNDRQDEWLLIDKNAKILFSDLQGWYSKDLDYPLVLDKNRAIVYRDGRYGIIDSKGEILLHSVYQSIDVVITESLDTLWLVKKNDKFGFRVQKGKTILRSQMYEKIEIMKTKSFGTLFLIGEIDRTGSLKLGLYDQTGKEMLPFRCDYIKEIETESFGTLFVVGETDRTGSLKLGLYDQKGKKILSREYEEIAETEISDVVMVSLKNDRYYFSLISREWRTVCNGGSVLCDNNGCYEVTGPNCQFYYKDGHFYDRENQMPKISAIDSKRPLIHNEMDGMSRLADKVGKETPADVDLNIPKGRTKNENTLCVIIANENYRRESNVEYALNDGEVFRRYCIETFGIPEKNIRFYSDATLNDMRAALGWLNRAVAACGSSSSVIFYYAGHGIPDEATRSAYLLPTDGYGSDVETGYALKNLYATLGKLSAEKVTVFLDACFSGAQRDGKMMASARGVAIKSKPESLQGNTVVLTAASDDETAYPYREKRHGLFTYYLLKKWQETQGLATLGELADYLRSEVVKESVLSNSKSQTPTVSCSPALTGTWETWKLK